MKKQDSQTEATPENRPAYICVPVPLRGEEMVFNSGVDLMNSYLDKGWLFMFERCPGPGERFFYFQRIDVGRCAK
jgi:hypothetical protein